MFENLKLDIGMYRMLMAGARKEGISMNNAKYCMANSIRNKNIVNKIVIGFLVKRGRA